MHFLSNSVLENLHLHIQQKETWFSRNPLPSWTLWCTTACSFVLKDITSDTVVGWRGLDVCLVMCVLRVYRRVSKNMLNVQCSRPPLVLLRIKGQRLSWEKEQALEFDTQTYWMWFRIRQFATFHAALSITI